MPKSPARLSALAFAASLAAGAALAGGVPFSEVDANGDGLLERHEMQAVFGEDATEDLMADDVDGDGALTPGEVAGEADEDETASAPAAAHPQNKSLPFSVIDLDGDGLLSRKEMVTTFGRNGAGLLRKDANGDGYISKEEVRGGDTDRSAARTARRDVSKSARATDGDRGGKPSKADRGSGRSGKGDRSGKGERGGGSERGNSGGGKGGNGGNGGGRGRG